MTEQLPQTKEVRLDWSFPKDLISRYASNIIVQHTKNEFIISFFEILPPILLGTPEERAAQAEEIESVQATCVARIVLTPNMISTLIKILEDNLDKYKSKFEDDGEHANE